MENDSDTALLLSLEAERCEAISTGDRVGLDALLTDDMQQIHASGVVEGKASYIDTLLQRRRRCERTGATSVRLYGDTAVITGPQRNVYADGTVGDMLTTLVWVRREGRWQLASSQSTHIQRR